VGLLAKLSRYLDDLLLLPDDARERAHVARAHLDAGRAAEALQAISEALDIRPDHPWLLFVAAEALRQLGETDQAVQMYRAALDADEDHAPSRVGLAYILRRQGDASSAAEELRRAVPHLWGSGEKGYAAQALVELAYCHLALDRPDRAVRELRKALTLSEQDVQLLALLGRTLALELGDESGARAAVARAVKLMAESSDGPALTAVGEAALAAGAAEQAVDLLRRAQEAGESVHLLLGRALLAQGEAMAAHEQVMRAMAENPASPEPHRLRAELAERAGDGPATLAALEAAVAADATDEVTVRCALVAAARQDLVRARPLAQTLLNLRPGDGLARAIELRATLASGEQPEGTAELLDELSNLEPRSAEVLLARAQWALDQADGEAALAALDQVESLESDRPELDQLSTEACRLVATGGSAEEPELFDILERVHGLMQSRTQWSELSVEIARIREDYDKPLLLTVMGEFNAGKSTFINAVAGEPVAPMGVTPTTATINVLKYGPERLVRVLHRSGKVKELAYEDLQGWLKGLSRQVAAEVRQVEILYPAEVLMRVNLVDTPGFNSIVPEHEKVARDFLERADAVVWLFDAGQPGKESERAALSAVTTAGKRVMGVLNKADRLDEAALNQVMDHLRQEGLADILEDILPMSARTALQAKSCDPLDDSALERSGLPHLERALEARFYSQARLIKRSRSACRLVDVLGQVLAQDAQGSAELQRGLSALAEAQHHLSSLAEGLREVAAATASRLADIRQAVAREAAEEVLEFIRPKRHLLDSHRFSREDRQYLLSLVEERLTTAVDGVAGQLTDQSSRHLEAFLSRFTGPTLSLLQPGDQEQLGREFGRYLCWTVLTLYRGFARGGRAERFFHSELPHLELLPDRVQQRISSWWEGVEELQEELFSHAAREVVSRLRALLQREERRLRQELTERRRQGAQPAAGFASLAKEWCQVATS
jgi:tetratricopeptide (TPR) repeat protein